MPLPQPHASISQTIPCFLYCYAKLVSLATCTGTIVHPLVCLSYMRRRIFLSSPYKTFLDLHMKYPMYKELCGACRAWGKPGVLSKISIGGDNHELRQLWEPICRCIWEDCPAYGMEEERRKESEKEDGINSHKALFHNKSTNNNAKNLFQNAKNIPNLAKN